MRSRKWFVAFVGVAVVGLSVASVGWACTGGLFTRADMTLTPNNGPLSGQSISVTGKNFTNSDGVPVATVDLYWLDEPFFAAGLGGPGDEGQQLDAQICKTKGVSLLKGVGVTSGAFGPVIVGPVPPKDPTYADGTPRLITAYPGANAVCAVWTHTPKNGGRTHDVGVGNQYNVFP